MEKIKEIGDLMDMGSWKARVKEIVLVVYQCESLDGDRYYLVHESGRVKRIVS